MFLCLTLLFFALTDFLLCPVDIDGLVIKIKRELSFFLYGYLFGRLYFWASSCGANLDSGLYCLVVLFLVYLKGLSLDLF